LVPAIEDLGEVWVFAPDREQSGVGHSVTFLSPLICQEIFDGDKRRGWAVEGSPADCVKIGIFEFCSRRPDLVVSGINGGLNAGINVLYSGTVAAAIEAHPEKQAMVWMRHGLVTWAETARESYQATIELVSTAETFLASRARHPVTTTVSTELSQAQARWVKVAPVRRGLVA
ncbi:MAG: class II aldolase/adducin family protein, partial [Acidobacteria bacterium]|nr:class II aldolase/adducin family protein [Acidobacteriota bacterium]